MSRASTKVAGKPLRAKRLRRRSDRSQSTLEIMERLLGRPVSISVNGEQTRASALQAIMLQLVQKVWRRAETQAGAPSQRTSPS